MKGISPEVLDCIRTWLWFRDRFGRDGTKFYEETLFAFLENEKDLA